jgi:hypothetical protein
MFFFEGWNTITKDVPGASEDTHGTDHGFDTPEETDPVAGYDYPEIQVKREKSRPMSHPNFDRDQGIVTEPNVQYRQQPHGYNTWKPFWGKTTREISILVRRQGTSQRPWRIHAVLPPSEKDPHRYARRIIAKMVTPKGRPLDILSIQEEGQ